MSKILRRVKHLGRKYDCRGTYDNVNEPLANMWVNIYCYGLLFFAYILTMYVIVSILYLMFE